MRPGTVALLLLAAVGLIAMGKKLGNVLGFSNETMRVRIDPKGNGHFEVTRTGHIHQGVDVLALEGEPVYSPINGTVVRTTNVYRDSTEWKGVVISGEGYEVKVFYVTPFVVAGEAVTRGQRIGNAQGISQRYGGAPMKDHVHIEVRRAADLALLNPEPLFGLA
jgi:murein DD-endopeptidase MepM/ murein hydrolase activator NlpD